MLKACAPGVACLMMCSLQHGASESGGFAWRTHAAGSPLIALASVLVQQCSKLGCAVQQCDACMRTAPARRTR